jgi:predicted ribosomally synthesized peptide with nif11-like leader
MDNQIAAFFSLVNSDPVLRKQLKDNEDRPEFFDQTVALARERGFIFTAEELCEALAVAKALKEIAAIRAA